MEQEKNKNELLSMIDNLSISSKNSVDDNNDDCGDDIYDSYSSDDNSSIGTTYTCVSKIDDVDFDWIDEIQENHEFMNDIPEVLKVKSILVNNNNNVIWINDETIITDEGHIENKDLISFINSKSKILRNQTNQNILVDDIQLFESCLNEDNIQECIQRSKPILHNNLFKQTQINYLKHNILLKPSISFFHSLNILLIVFRFKKTLNKTRKKLSKHNNKKGTRKHIYS